MHGGRYTAAHRRIISVHRASSRTPRHPLATAFMGPAGYGLPPMRVCRFPYPYVFRTMSGMARFEMRASDDWLRMIDLARGGESRGGFVRRVMEGVLGGVVPEDALPSARVVPAARVVPGPGLDEADERRVRAGLAPLGRSPALERFRP